MSRLKTAYAIWRWDWENRYVRDAESLVGIVPDWETAKECVALMNASSECPHKDSEGKSREFHCRECNLLTVTDVKLGNY